MVNTMDRGWNKNQAMMIRRDTNTTRRCEGIILKTKKANRNLQLNQRPTL